MNKTLLMAALLAAPSLTFAGGMGNMSYSDMMNRAQSGTTTVNAPSFGSTEDPASILESREVTGSENEDYVRYSFGYIPNSYWDQYLDLGDVNGFVELEEYLGETEREVYTAGEDSEREAERQERARNKALRLRSTYGY